MSRPKEPSPLVDEVRPYLHGVAKNLIDKVYGPQGPAWGTSLTQIEDLLLDIRSVLTESMLDAALSRQAASLDQQPDRARACPGCKQPLEYGSPNPRIIQTRAGEASWQEPGAYCRPCRRAFFPSGQEALGIDQTDLGPALQEKACYAGIAGSSYEHGRGMLLKSADLTVSIEHVERLTDRIGEGRVAQRDAEVAAFVELPLVEKFAVPAGVAAPAAVAVMCDGGRIQILDRRAGESSATPEATPEATQGATAGEKFWEKRQAAASGQRRYRRRSAG